MIKQNTPKWMTALTQRVSKNASLLEALSLYFGQHKTASAMKVTSLEGGLRLLDELCKTTPSTELDEKALYIELVQLALDRPNLRTELVPLLVYMNSNKGDL